MPYIVFDFTGGEGCFPVASALEPLCTFLHTRGGFSPTILGAQMPLFSFFTIFNDSTLQNLYT